MLRLACRQQTAVSQFNQVRAMAHREHLALRWQRQLFTFWKAISTDREAFIRDHLQAVGKRQLARAFCSWRSAAKESVAVGQQVCYPVAALPSFHVILHARWSMLWAAT